MENFYTPGIDTKEGFHEMQGKAIGVGKIFDGWTTWYFGQDAFRSPEEAAAKARELRAKKIASLKKQIAKLEAFED